MDNYIKTALNILNIQSSFYFYDMLTTCFQIAKELLSLLQNGKFKRLIL